MYCKEFIPVLKRAIAIIAEEGLTSHAAIVGLEMNIPVIVGVDNATERLQTGEKITVDAQRGLIYYGKVNVK